VSRCCKQLTCKSPIDSGWSPRSGTAHDVAALSEHEASHRSFATWRCTQEPSEGFEVRLRDTRHSSRERGVSKKVSKADQPCRVLLGCSSVPDALVGIADTVCVQIPDWLTQDLGLAGGRCGTSYRRRTATGTFASRLAGQLCTSPSRRLRMSQLEMTVSNCV